MHDITAIAAANAGGHPVAELRQAPALVSDHLRSAPRREAAAAAFRL